MYDNAMQVLSRRIFHRYSLPHGQRCNFLFIDFYNAKDTFNFDADPDPRSDLDKNESGF